MEWALNFSDAFSATAEMIMSFFFSINVVYYIGDFSLLC